MISRLLLCAFMYSKPGREPEFSIPEGFWLTQAQDFFRVRLPKLQRYSPPQKMGFSERRLPV